MRQKWKIGFTAAVFAIGMSAFAYPMLSDAKEIQEHPEFISGENDSEDGWRQIEGKWYFFQEGTPVTGWWEDQGKTYYFNSDGVMQTGWVCDEENKWFYMNPNGQMRTGWLELNGKWYYLKDNKARKGVGDQPWDAGTGEMLTGVVGIGANKIYFFDQKTGAMLTNAWCKSGDEWYYAGKNGELQTGWLNLANKWFYLNPDGYSMVTGTNVIGGKTYYFENNGKLITNKWVEGVDYEFWMKNGERECILCWAYPDSTGVCKPGWKTIAGKTYYFAEYPTFRHAEGVPTVRMAFSEYRQGYWLNSDGTWTYKPRAQWHKDKNGWWYGDSAGWYAKGTELLIDGKLYSFDLDGYLMEYKRTDLGTSAKNIKNWDGGDYPGDVLAFTRDGNIALGIVKKGYYMITETNGKYYSTCLDKRSMDSWQQEWNQNEYRDILNMMVFELSDVMNDFDTLLRWRTVEVCPMFTYDYYCSGNLSKVQKEIQKRTAAGDVICGFYNLQANSKVYIYNTKNELVETLSAEDLSKRILNFEEK